MSETQTLEPEVIPAAPPAAVTPPVETPPEPDFFTDELAQLRAEAEKEAAPPAATPPGPAADVQQFAKDADGGQQPPAAQPPAGQPAAPPQIMIPKARFDEVALERAHYQQQVAYLQGQLDAQAFQQQQPQQQQPPVQQQPEVKPLTVDDLAAAREKLANEYEGGNLTFPQWAKENAKLDAQVLQIAQQAQTAATQAAARAAAPPDPIVMNETMLKEQAVKEQEASNPFLWLMSGQELEPVTAQASAMMAKRGWTPQTPGYAAEQVRVVGHLVMKNGEEHTGLNLQQAHAQVLRNPNARNIYRGPQAPAAGGNPAGGQQQPGNGTGNPNPTPEQMARAKKLGIQANMPPTFQGNGTVAAPAPISEKQIEAMSDDEIAALPKEVRQRIFPQL